MPPGFGASLLTALEHRSAIAAGAALFRGVRAIGGATAESKLSQFIEAHIVQSGWPRHQEGWINLHASRWLRLSRRRAARSSSGERVALRAAGDRWRVGMVGEFSGLLSFPKELFTRIPDGIDVFIFDRPFRGGSGGFLKPLVAGYCELPAGADQNDAAARSIDEADLDMLMVIGPKPDAYELLDRVRTRAVMNYCTGSDLMYHERLDFQMHGQPQADYFVRNERMFCGLTMRPLSDAVVMPIEIGFYDRRSLPVTAGPSWSDRDPLIVFHGSLHKFARPRVLDAILPLLAEDTSVSLALMGRDIDRSLEAIMTAARARGVESRVHYEGSFSAVRDETAGVADPGWTRLVNLLQKARLAPDPFPIGGGSSRFEAYVLGAPSVHLGVRFDDAALGRRQDSACDVLFLNTKKGTAFDVAEYRRLCSACLHDGDFAGALAAEQYAIADSLTDSHAWWIRLRTTCETWRRQCSAV
ncbi:MAG: hypothetical protein K2Y23_04675 [Cyanobacteria bacterium]|nr:hypothetical protein [Cyanobacteriota bacterium]